MVCSYGRGKRGQNRGQNKHVVGAFWGQGGQQLRCGQEQDSKSAVAVWVGLPCFCIQGDGMQSPAPLNKSPDDVHSKCGSNEHLSSSESQKRPSKESRLCPHWSADSSLQKDWNFTKCPLLPPLRESCPKALPQAAAAGSVFLNRRQYTSLQTPPPDSTAHPGIWLKLGGDPCREEFCHFQAAETHATRPLGAPQCHQKPSRLQTLHGEAA